MTTLVALTLIFVTSGLAVGDRWRRSRRRDEKSIESHRSTLGVIEHVAGADDVQLTHAERNAAHVRIVGTPAASSPRALEDGVLPTKPPQWPKNRPSFPLPKEHDLQPPDLPFSAGGPASGSDNRPTAPRPPAAPRPAASAGAEHLRALRGPGGHRSRLLVGAAVLSLVVAAAGVALATGGIHHRGNRTAHQPSLSGGAQRSSPQQPLSPTTTVSPVPTVVPTASNSDYATYTANSASLTVDLVVSSACWIELRNGSANGPLLYQGTLRAGVSQSFPTTGSIWLRLGDPAGVRLTINGAPVVLPASASPFDVSVNTPA